MSKYIFQCVKDDYFSINYSVYVSNIYMDYDCNRRFISFSETNTLHLGTIVKTKDRNKIVGVCIAGIYPDSKNNFSTIYQVSVLPEYRRQGIAKAMILNSINHAHKVSPVIGLGVLVGNPAEILYQNLGFIKGPEYFRLEY